MTSVYVYGFTSCPIKTTRMAGHTLRSISIDGICAVVEYVDTPPELTEVNLHVQHDVLSRIHARVDSLVPARFGAFMDTDELGRVMRLRRMMLRDTLKHVRSRVQMTTRIYGREGAPPGANRIGVTIASGRDYLRARRDSRRLPPEARAFSEALGPLVVDQRAVRGKGHVVATLFHLIRRSAAERYRHRVRAAAERRGLHVVVSGPFPPFAFAPELWS